MSLDASLKTALRQLRATKARRPVDPVDPSEFAAWRDAIAEALDDMAATLPHENDRVMARAEAEAARAQAAQIRSTINRSADCG